MRIMTAAFVVLAATGANAEGFAIRDLSTIAGEANAALGGGFTHRAEPKRLTLTCPACDGAPMIDVLIGRQTDGTEERVRSGQTTIAKLDRLCKDKNPACRIDGLSVAPAVGWISSYPMGSTTFGSTAVILRGGDLLTIRSIAADAGVARRNAEKLATGAALKIVGR